MEFKYAVFFTVLLVGVPAGIFLASLSRVFERIVWGMMIFSGVLGEGSSINFLSFETYGGSSRGVEVSLVDICMLVILGLMILRGVKMRWKLPGLGFYLFYWGLSLVSIVNAENFLYSFAEAWKMLRMCLFFLTSCNYILWRREFEVLFYGLGGIAILNLIFILPQKYLLHIYQPRGLFPHQNSMAVYMELIGPLLFSRWLNVKSRFFDDIFFGAAFVAATGSALLSFSRGAFLLYPLGCLAVVLWSFRNGVDTRKISILASLIGIGAVGLMLVLPGMIQRVETAPEVSKNTRINLAVAAVNMANDKFFGVGLNNWGIKINPPYRYSEHRIGRRYTDDFKDGIVETIYMLVAGECGWIGLFSLLLWFGFYWVSAFRLALVTRGAGSFFLPLGVWAGSSVVFVHSVLEWVMKQTPNFYQLMLCFSLITVCLIWKKNGVLATGRNFRAR